MKSRLVELVLVKNIYLRQLLRFHRPLHIHRDRSNPGRSPATDRVFDDTPLINFI